MLEAPHDRAPHKPIEEIQIDADDAFIGKVVNALAERRAELIELQSSPDGTGAARGFTGRRAA